MSCSNNDPKPVDDKFKPAQSSADVLKQVEYLNELIQSELNTENLKAELNHLINKKESIKDDYEKLIKLLGISGASKNAAKFITDSI